MFDWFNTHNDNERHEWRPRIIFATLRHSARPILSEQGYKTFSATTFGLWAFGLAATWLPEFDTTQRITVVIVFAIGMT